MTVEERLATFLGAAPPLPPSVYVADSARVMGDVRLGECSSVWHCAVLRGDINTIHIGERTNIQDGAVIHVADDLPTRIGNDVTVGHGAIIHACTIGDECLIGMRATVLDGAVVGAQSIIGAGAVVTQGAVIPPGSMVLGMPAKVVRPLSTTERAGIKVWAEKYLKVAEGHRSRLLQNEGSSNT